MSAFDGVGADDRPRARVHALAALFWPRGCVHVRTRSMAASPAPTHRAAARAHTADTSNARRSSSEARVDSSAHSNACSHNYRSADSTLSQRSLSFRL